MLIVYIALAELIAKNIKYPSLGRSSEITISVFTFLFSRWWCPKNSSHFLISALIYRYRFSLFSFLQLFLVYRMEQLSLYQQQSVYHFLDVIFDLRKGIKNTSITRDLHFLQRCKIFGMAIEDRWHGRDSRFEYNFLIINDICSNCGVWNGKSSILTSGNILSLCIFSNTLSPLITMTINCKSIISEHQLYQEL